MPKNKKNQQLNDDEMAQLLKEALEKPGVKEVMEVYGQWEGLLARFKEYNQAIQDKEVITFSTSTS